MNLSHVRGFLSIREKKTLQFFGNLRKSSTAPSKTSRWKDLGSDLVSERTLLSLGGLPGLKVVGIFEVIHSLITIQVPTPSTGKVAVRKDEKAWLLNLEKFGSNTA